MPRREDHPHVLRIERPNGAVAEQGVDDFAGAVRAAERLAPLIPHDAEWSVVPTGGDR